MHSLAKTFQEKVLAAKSVLVASHLNPDGDALGSCLGVSYYLESLGIQHDVVRHSEVPQNLKFLPGIERIRRTPTMDRHDLGIVLDLDSTERLGSTAEYFEKCDEVIVIDHHVPHEAPGDFRIVDQSAAATAAILTRMFLELDAPISPAMATCLLAGIVTDTGSYRFRNTNAEALILSGRLLEAGGDITLISEEVFQNKPLSAVRLLGLMLEHMTLDSSEQLAWGTICFGDFQETHATDEDTEGFVNEMLAIQTVRIAALFRETKPNWVRVSLRSRGEFDVSAIAREFGGGGHKNAAGCSFDLPIDEAVDLVVPKLRECLESS